jgi:glucose dehydrogenase
MAPVSTRAATPPVTAPKATRSEASPCSADAFNEPRPTRSWPDEPGHDSWVGDSWLRGGGAVWVTGSYDPDLNLVYWGTGNPGPDFNGDNRLGDNLYTDSVVALDADTGKLKWHFQFTPHDEFDYDSTQVPVLADVAWQGRPRKVMLGEPEWVLVRARSRDWRVPLR